MRAVRNPDAPAKVGHLVELAASLPGTLKLFKADLLDEGSYDAAIQGCRIVFHTASPFTLNVKDAQKDLVDPPYWEPEMFSSANRTASVERVVLTSSCAAIYGDNADLKEAPIRRLMSPTGIDPSLTHQAYSYSKTVAEKAAWKWQIVRNRWRLVVINPSFVIGPGFLRRVLQKVLTCSVSLATAD